MKRPLFAALVLLIGWILCFYDPPDTDIDRLDGRMVTVKAKVDSITGHGDDTVLNISDILLSDERIPGACIKVYASKDKKTNISKTSFSGLKIGNLVSVTGTLKSLSVPGNPGQFDERAYYHSQGICAKMFANKVAVLDESYDKTSMWLRSLREYFRDAFFELLPKSEAGTVSAMVLGDKSLLDDEISDLYKENGIAHVLAISGLHISMVGLGLFFLLKKYLMPMRVSCIITMIILFLYGELTGFSLSARRAVFMGIILLVSRLIGEKYDRLNALFLAAIIELILHPESLKQSGFLLSYGTVLGIAVFVDRFQKITSQILGASIGVFLITMPILIESYHEIPILSPIVNLLILPFMSILLGVSILGGGIYIIIPFVSRMLIGSVYVILWLYRAVCTVASYVPMHTIIVGHRSMIGVFIYYFVLILFVSFAHKIKDKKYRVISSVIIVIINIAVFILPSSYDSRLFITNLDVGQGDSCVIHTPDNRTILIDGGSSDIKDVGKYRIVPFLKYEGINTIDYMIITHSDADHINGLTEMITDDSHMGIDIKNIVMPFVNNPDDNYLEFEKSASISGINTLKIKAGDEIHIGDIVLKCLHPTKDYLWEDVNDYSTVLQIDYKSFKGLFTGDLGFHGEESLNDLQDVDYLKVGHHGSKNSSGESFLSIVRPEIAVASAGHNNRYHHPSKEALKRLGDIGAKVYDTITGGAITTVTDGENVYVKTYL